MTAFAATLPALRNEGSLVAFLRDIRRFPMLEAAEEYMLAKAWRDDGDLSAAHKLVTSHLRLVAKIALGYRGYGLPAAELVSEGNVGLMQAVKRFDPERGFRLATYAMWWIKASIQEYVLRSWSLVKIGTTAAQKKLFFNLRRIKRAMRAIDEGDLSPEQVTYIAEQLAVEEGEVVDMNRRLSGGDLSLNASVRTEDGDGGEWQDRLADETANQEILMGEGQELVHRQRLLSEAMNGLNEREREIIVARRLSDPPVTLEDLSQKHNVSRERIRQIESRAFEKLQNNIVTARQVLE